MYSNRRVRLRFVERFQVLGERSQQIKEKAESNRLKQAELLQEREALLEDLEQVQKTARLSKEEEERRKKIR